MARAQYDLNWTSTEDNDVRNILSAWESARRAKAREEMRVQAKQLGERSFFQAENGFGGEVRSMIHPSVFHYWGQRLGYQCWDDQQFVHEFLRDNPEARVKNHARQTTLLVRGNGGLAASCRKRFFKRYETRAALTPTLSPREREE